MANGAVELTKIALSRLDNGSDAFRFTALMTNPQGEEFTVPVQPADLLSYAGFQAAVLQPGGWLFRYSNCEGRSADAADEHWKSAIASVMEQPTSKTPAIN